MKEEIPTLNLPSSTSSVLNNIRREKKAEAESELREDDAENCGALTEMPALGPPDVDEGVDLPKGKEYFRIGEVAELIGVEPHVLRYWESEFPMIRPSKSGGQRVYRRKDVRNLHLIRQLLHIERFSIKGAKKKLAELKHRGPAKQETVVVEDTALLKDLAGDLRELIRIAERG